MLRRGRIGLRLAICGLRKGVPAEDYQSAVLGRSWDLQSAGLERDSGVRFNTRSQSAGVDGCLQDRRRSQELRTELGWHSVGPAVDSKAKCGAKV